jgi:hypothetical protein
VLEPLQARAGLVGREPEYAASREGVVLTVEIDAGVVASMVEDPPHVWIDSTDIENIVQGFVYRWNRRDGIVVAVVRDIQQKESLGKAIQKVDGYKPPWIQLERVESNPASRQHCQTHGDFDPHRAIGFGRNVPVGKEIIEAAA